MVLSPKKTMAGLLTGTLIFGAAAWPLTQVYAADTVAPQAQTQTQQTHKHKQMDPEQAAQHIAALFNVAKGDVLNLYNHGQNIKTIAHAAFLAEASGHSLNDVMAMKTDANTWKDVANQLGLTKDQMKAERGVMMGRMMHQRFGVDASTVTALLQQGHHRRDVMMAAMLAKQTDKPITAIIALKTQDNKWKDVAATLGVSDQDFKNDMKALRHFKHAGHYI